MNEKKIKLKLICTLVLILAVTLITACGGVLASENSITDKEEMISAFSSVNEAILHFNNLKKGTIITESTGSFMPGGTAVKDELQFEKTAKGTLYKITETYAKGDSFVKEEIAENDLPETAFIYYPNKELSDDNFDTAEKVTITKTNKGTQYKADWSLTQFTLPEGVTLKKLYSSYTIDDNNYLVEVVHYRSYKEQKSGNSEAKETTEQATITLTDYSE